ncbi:SIR2 family protein [bacterium]|nr:SIR2 family protein [bacterium]
MPELTQELTKELDKVRKALQSGRNDVIVFVGAGLSSPPLAGWEELLGQLADSVPGGETARASLADGKLREAAAALESPATRPEIEKALVAHSAKPQGPRPDIFRTLVELPLKHYVTGNRDPWLKQALVEKLGAPRVLVPSDANSLSDLSPQSGACVLMLHGDAERPETLVLAEAGYGTLGKAPSSYAGAVKALVGSRKVLFLGCSPRDPDVAGLLEEWADIFGPDEAAGLSAPRHFFLGAGLTEVEKALLFKLRIRPSEIGAPGDAGALGQAIAYLAGTAPPPPPPAVETTRARSRPSSVFPGEKPAPQAAEAPAAAPAVAPSPPKEKYDPLAKVRQSELEAALKAREADVKRLEGELAVVRERAERAGALEKEIAQLHEHDAEASKLAEEIANAFEQRDAEATASEAEVAKLRAENETLRSGAQAPAGASGAATDDRRLAELEARLRERDGKLGELTLRVKEREEQLQERDARIKSLEERPAAAPAAGSDAGETAKKYQARAAIAETKCLVLENELSKLRQEAASKPDEKGEAEEDDESGEEAEALRAAHAAETASLESEIAELRAKLMAEQEKAPAPARASKVPLLLGMILLVVGLGTAGVAIVKPELLDPIRGWLGTGDEKH